MLKTGGVAGINGYTGFMRNHRSPRPLVNVLAAALVGVLASAFTPAQIVPSGPKGDGVPNFWVRPGFRVDRMADVPNARFLEFGGGDTLFVARPAGGEIVTLRRNAEGTFTRVAAFVSGVPELHSLQFRDGWLWFTGKGFVKRARDTDGDGVADEVVTVLAGLPSGGGHSFRSLLVTDDAIYTSIGDSSNATDETNTERQKIWRFNLDGSAKTLFASGIRNTEKLRLRPGPGGVLTDEIYGADHGSDGWGANLGEGNGRQPFTDVIPPDEFNRYEQGKFYGHPFVIGDRIPRFEYMNRSDIVSLGVATTIPAWKFGAHNAPNGFAFSSVLSNLSTFGNDAYVALHGSWNSTVKVGYGIQRVMFDTAYGTPFGGQTMVSCLEGQNVLGRPVDVVEDPNGGLLWTDDMTGRVYRLLRDRPRVGR